MIYPDIYNGPPRHYGDQVTAKRYVAIHNTSNDASAETEASYAKRREDSVSSHYYVDSNSIVQSLDTKLRAFHAGSAEGNGRAIAYEITGTNGKTRTWWLANVTWLPLARQIAADCRVHGIEPRLLTVADIKAGKLTGLITHDQMRQAWGGTTHTDPGPNFPLEHLLGLVVAEMEADMALSDDDVKRIATATAKAVWETLITSPSLDVSAPARDWLKKAEDGRRATEVVDGKVDELLARPPVVAGPVDAAEIAKAVNDDQAARMQG